MATALEYGVIAAGLSVAIIAATNLLAEKTPVSAPKVSGFVDQGWKDSDGHTIPVGEHMYVTYFKSKPDSRFWDRAFSACEKPQRADGKIRVMQYKEDGARDDFYVAGCPN